MSQQMEHARATPSRCLLPPMRKGKDTVFASLNLFTSLAQPTLRHLVNMEHHVSL